MAVPDRLAPFIRRRRQAFVLQNSGIFRCSRKSPRGPPTRSPSAREEATLNDKMPRGDRMLGNDTEPDGQRA